MKTSAFIHENFLLESDSARELYHHFSENEPIFDYHCHLPPDQIAKNHTFADLYEIWLAGDHYKWRAMRSHGIPERLCTGDATAKEKYLAWTETVPYTLRNPLYHWSHLELKRYFGIDAIISPATAEEIWEEAGRKLPHMRIHDILEKNRVAAICTTDDPADSLEHHEAIRRSGIKTRVYPTFRPDKSLAVHQPENFNAWLDRLAQTSGVSIQNFDDLLSALKKRHDDFHAFGCRLSDHGLGQCLSEPATHAQARAVFDVARSGRTPSAEDCAIYGSFLMREFGRWDAARGWTKQLHLGALRNNNSRLFRMKGPDIGCDSIGDLPQAAALSRYLDSLDETNELPRIIIYNLNPADNYLFATMIGNFQDGSRAGKIQYGSGWWFLDQKEAMEWQINTLSHLALLRHFVGMLTDSRSFLSYTRHEYFRRILCNLVGRDVELGLLPADMETLGQMVKEISFTNAKNYFGLELDPSFKGASL